MRQRHALVDRVQTPADPSQSELDGPPVELRAPSSAATRDGVHEQDQGDDDHRSDGDDGDGGRGDDHATFLSWNSRVETNLAVFRQRPLGGQVPSPRVSTAAEGGGGG